MSEVTTKASLTPARRRLLELMQEINFGRIEGLAVRGGEPVLDPPPARGARDQVRRRKRPET